MQPELPANLLSQLQPTPLESTRTLLTRAGLRIEHIVSWGHSSSPDFWYDQPQGEWVAVLQGRARLEFADGREPLDLEAGSYVDIPAGCRHRVAWTDPDQATVWLAVHYG